MTSLELFIVLHRLCGSPRRQLPLLEDSGRQLALDVCEFLGGQDIG